MKKINYFLLPTLLAVAALTLTACGDDENDNSKKSNTEYVDLGLSVKWASCNLGAKNPWEAGNYYAWGETKPKSEYLEANYIFNDFSSDNHHLSASNDAATVVLGSAWHTPTESEVNELIENCDWTWSVFNGVQGTRVTGKNGNSIFIPVSGCFRDSEYNGYFKSSEDNVCLWINYTTYVANYYPYPYHHTSYLDVHEEAGNRVVRSVKTIEGSPYEGMPVRPVHQ